MWWVYVIQSQEPRYSRRGSLLPGFFYVGASTEPLRRLRQHNGEIVGGGKYTSKHRPWVLRAVFGPYSDKSEAMKAEWRLKHTKRGEQRLQWSPSDSDLCRGLGVAHPWVIGDVKDTPEVENEDV